MQTHFVGKGCTDLVNLNNIGKEFTEFENRFPHLQGAGWFCALADMLLHMEYATAGRSDDVIVAMEIFGEKPKRVFAIVFKSRICHRLSAASLCCGKIHVQT